MEMYLNQPINKDAFILSVLFLPIDLRKRLVGRYYFAAAVGKRKCIFMCHKSIALKSIFMEVNQAQIVT